MSDPSRKIGYSFGLFEPAAVHVAKHACFCNAVYSVFPSMSLFKKDVDVFGRYSHNDRDIEWVYCVKVCLYDLKNCKNVKNYSISNLFLTFFQVPRTSLKNL